MKYRSAKSHHAYKHTLKHKSIKGPSSLTWFTITIENSNTSKYGTAVAKKEKEGKENNAFYRGHFPLLASFCLFILKQAS